jgi:hypothetical protein
LGAHSMVTFETKIFDIAGDLVCTAISTLVVRGDEECLTRFQNLSNSKLAR